MLQIGIRYFLGDNNELVRDLIEEVAGICVLLIVDFNYPGIG